VTEKRLQSLKQPSIHPLGFLKAFASPIRPDGSARPELLRVWIIPDAHNAAH
jgi:hypothetical protein